MSDSRCEHRAQIDRLLADHDRMRRDFRYAVFCVTIVGLTMGAVLFVAGMAFGSWLFAH